MRRLAFHLPAALALALALAEAAGAQYQTNFDDDVGWTFTSSHPTFGWDVDAVPDMALSPPTSLNVQYAEGAIVNAYALSPAIDISAMAFPELSFWTKADVAEDVCVYDIRRVSVYPAAGGPALFDYCLSQRNRSGQPYEQYRVPLDPAWGNVRVRFAFLSVDDFANGGDGWFLDDMEVDEVACPAPLYYCVAAENSASAFGALIYANGSTSVSANDLQLQAKDTPKNQFAIFFFGPETTFVPLGDGFRCVGGAFKRLPVVPTGSGVPTLDVDYGQRPADLLVIGSTWYFQCWYRDPAGPTTSNLSDGAGLTFCP